MNEAGRRQALRLYVSLPYGGTVPGAQGGGTTAWSGAGPRDPATGPRGGTAGGRDIVLL